MGCAYFKKHKSVFLPSFPTPTTLYNSVTHPDLKEKHSEWLQLIRDRIWSRIQYEEEMVPSVDALFRHWRRSCWVSSVWNQAALNRILCPPLEQFGWKKPDASTLAIDWESETNVSVVREQVAFIQKGCGCRTGCSTARCKCKKHNSHCGPGCKCTGCTNLPAMALPSSHLEQNCDSESERESTSGSGDENLEERVNELMHQVFGDSSEEFDDNTESSTCTSL